MSRPLTVHVRIALALAASAGLLVACEHGFFAAPGAEPRAGRVSLAVTASGVAGGAKGAFARADQIHLQLTPQDTSAAPVDTLLPLSGSTTLELEVPLKQASASFAIAVEVLYRSQALFRGTGAVTLKAGESSPATIDLAAVASRLDLPASFGPMTALGSTLQLGGAVVFASGDTVPGATLSWSSLDPATVSVTADGLATARAEGEARVQAKYLSMTADARVTVSAVVRSVTVTPTQLQLALGGTGQLTAIVTDALGNVLARPVTWSSSDTSVAAVDGSGHVLARRPGSAQITAAAGGQSSAAVPVQVVLVPVATVSVQPSSKAVLVGQTVQLQATTRDSAGSVLTGRVIAWKSSSDTIAAVDASGLVTGRSPGNATITATSEGRSGSASISVANPVLTVSGAGTGNGTVTSIPAGISCSVAGGVGSGTCSGSFPASVSLTLTANAAAGHTFTGWSGACTGTATCTLSLTENASVTATFAAPVTYAITTSANPTGGGTTSGAGTFAAGQLVTVAAAPATCYAFVNWTEAGNPASTSATYSFSATANRALVANFSLQQFTIATLTNPPAGGTTTGAGTYTCGASVSVTATPASGYSFGSWTEAGNVVSSGATYTFTVGGTRTLLANFQASAAPVINFLSQSLVVAGSGSFTLRVFGSGFLPSSQVLWNGSARQTTFVSATEVDASIGAADVATPRIISVTVASGSLISNSTSLIINDFTITSGAMSVTVNDSAACGTGYNLFVLSFTFTDSFGGYGTTSAAPASPASQHWQFQPSGRSFNTADDAYVDAHAGTGFVPSCITSGADTSVAVTLLLSDTLGFSNSYTVRLSRPAGGLSAPGGVEPISSPATAPALRSASPLPAQNGTPLPATTSPGRTTEATRVEDLGAGPRRRARWRP